MTSRSKAGWFCFGAVALVACPYVIVFGLGTVWMWQHGLIWYWALGTGVPSLVGLALFEWARRRAFPKDAGLPLPPPAATAAGQAALEAVRGISQRVQAEDPPLDQPDALEKLASKVLLEVLDAVARQYRPDDARPVLQAPVAHIAALVELVARDFRRAFSERVPWGNTVTLGRLLWWKQKGELSWRTIGYLWQLNRLQRMLLRPASAIVQEVQDHMGQNMAAKSAEGLKRWAIDFCIAKAGHYAIQLYSGGFVLDEEYRPRVSPPVAGLPFEQEPLQILVAGQVKSGKSSLINALLDEMRAPVDSLPTTENVDLYEGQPEGLPCLVLRDTPGYDALSGKPSSVTSLCKEVQDCDLWILVCSARSAARKADREVLQAVREFYDREPKRMMPPMICVLTHCDTLPAELTAEAVDAVAEDLGIPARQIVAVCAQWGRLANRDGLVAALADALPEAERVKVFRCIRQIRQEQAEDKVFHQIVNGLRLTGGWVVGKK